MSKPRKYIYDSYCEMLAEHFLDEHRDEPQYRQYVQDLSQQFQDAAELFCGDLPELS